MITARATILALATLSGACGAEPVLINVGTPTDYDPPETDDELVAEAFDILGLEYKTTTRPYGAVSVDLIGPPGEDWGGLTIQRLPCRRRAMSSRDARTLAHEIGHMLGLDHTCEGIRECYDLHDGNLMTGANLGVSLGAGSDLTDEQYDTIQHSAASLAACR